jgi:ABC-type amino acid transport substrate-binding protein
MALLLAANPVPGLDLAEIKAKGVLRVIAAADEAPETFSFAGGENPGIDRELVEGFARLHGLRVEAVKAKTYADRIPSLTRGEGDLIVAIFDTEDRRKLVDFTVEIMPTHNVAVTLEPRKAVASIAELKGLRVGAVRGARPAEETLEAGVPASALQLFADLDEMTQALKAGSLDAMVVPVSELAVASRTTRGLTAGAAVGPTGKVAWAVRKQDRALRAALDDYLTNVRRSPSWSRLIVKYFGDQALQVLGRAR